MKEKGCGSRAVDLQLYLNRKLSLVKIINDMGIENSPHCDESHQRNKAVVSMTLVRQPS